MRNRKNFNIAIANLASYYARARAKQSGSHWFYKLHLGIEEMIRLHELKNSMRIYCAGCNHEVQARLTTGEEIYSHRQDLFSLPFWICDTCGNYVGCHYKTKDRTKPLGIIPTPELRDARRRIHAILDPMWKSGKVRRDNLYRLISQSLGYEYHTAELRTVDEAQKVLGVIGNLGDRQ